MITKFNTTVLTCLLVLTMSSLVNANLVQVRDSASSSGYFVSGTSSNSLKIKEGSNSRTISAGTFNFDIRNADSKNWLNFQAYCIELGQTIKFGHNPTDTVGKPYEVINLVDYSGITTSDVSFLGVLWANAFDLSTQNAQAAAAFQTLVWEVISDSKINLTGGWFELKPSGSTFTNGVMDLANDWIDNIGNNSWTTTTELFVLANGQSQDFITTVPEPSSMALALLGGAMLLGRGRRKDRVA